MSISDRYRRKLAAFLHDPIDKPLVLMQTGVRHEERARRLQELLGLADLPDASPASDHVASAMERAFVPERATDGGRIALDFLQNPEIRHPFSGRRLEGLGDFSDLALDRATSGVEDAVEVVADRIGEEADFQQAFFTLWRTLLPALREQGPAAVAPYWPVLPADTRIPDHGVFQHLTVTSAFSGMETVGEDLYTDATFLLVTLGPAQAFIQQARKTQDLYWGSALLSRLTWTAMKPVVERHGPDAVFFPDLYGQPLVDKWLHEHHGISLPADGRVSDTTVPTLPNRFFAVVEAGDQQARADLLGDIEAAVHERLDALAGAVFDSGVVPEEKQGRVPTDAVAHHLRDALSVHGVALPYQPGDAPLTATGVLDAAEGRVGGGELAALRELVNVADGPETRYDASPGHVYSLLHTLTEKLLAAQKNTRAFAPLPSNEPETPRNCGERGRKCSLCGERNVLFYRGEPAQIRHNQRALSVGEAPGIDAAQMREGEGLCGTCFVKRFVGRTDALGGPTGSFPSTTEVALAPLRERHGSTFRQVQQKLREIVGEGGGTFDDQLFFEENLRPGYLAKYVFPDKDEGEDRDWLEGKAEALQTELDDKMPEGLQGAMTKYYGLLVLDGDNMGDWVAGTKAPRFEDIYHSDVWAQLPPALQEQLTDLRSPDGEKGKRPLTPALHASLSRALTDYALEAVRPIVESEHNGTLVYAGGDDVLAFVPLSEALDVALHLRAAFSGHRPLPVSDEEADAPPEIDFEADVSGFRRRNGRVVTTLGPTASASVGLAVAHYKTPLGEVLSAARGMEKRAKETGRNRLAVALLKRSGERTDGVVPFQDVSVPEPRGPVGIFQDLVRALTDEGLALSPSFVRTLQQELRPLLGEDGDLGGNFAPDDAETLVKSEIKRLMRRSIDADAPDRGRAFVKEMPGRLVNACDAIDSVGTFLDVLDVSLFLQRKTARSDVRPAHTA